MNDIRGRWQVDRHLSEPAVYVGQGPVSLYRAHSVSSWAEIAGLTDEQGKRVAQAFLYGETYI